jgi:hypothetical protein
MADGFFSIDRGAFRCAAVGGLNSAIAHLILARGTGPDNVTTQWSVNAIEQRTGISRPNAAKAVKDLLARGIWKKTREGLHPIYEAVPGNQIPGGPFTAEEQAAIAAIREGKPVYQSKATIEALKARGIVRTITTQDRRRGRYYNSGTSEQDVDAIATLSEPLAVWLPNALIDGAAGEVPPIELIRQTRDQGALRMLVELYAAQFLPNYGGVPRDLLKVVFDRAKVGEQGPFVIWGFQSKHIIAGRELYGPFLVGQHTTDDDGTRRDIGMKASFWPAVDRLENLGLVEKVGMLLDGDDADAEIIHPYAMRGGEPAERELAHAAHTAALGMVTEGQRINAEEKGFRHLVAVRKHIVNAAVAEVYRLRYRPHTKATAAWFALMQDNTSEYLAEYQAMTKGGVAAAISAADGRMQYQG